VVPVALLGTFAALLALGFSINVLTMFGMVLVIGIVVDDAIVVVENVERIMSRGGPAAARGHAQGHGPDLGRHHRRDRGADLGVRAAGLLRRLHRQHLPPVLGGDGGVDRFSAFMALSLTPALCATLLKPVEAGHHQEKRGFFGWFNRGFSRTAKGYESWSRASCKRAARYLIIYAAIIGAVALIYLRLPTSFLPQEDQGNMLVNVQLPPGATWSARRAVMEQVEGFMLKQPEVQSMVGVLGFSFSGQGQNAALAFVTLKDWDERKGEEHSASALAGRAFGALWASAMPSSSRSARRRFPNWARLPASPSACRTAAATATRRCRRAQPAAGHGRQEQGAHAGAPRRPGRRAAAAARHRPRQGQRAGRDLRRDQQHAVDRAGLSYVNDFPNRGRLQRVVVQADAPARMQPEDLLR
jgi:multidrug efflux pump